MNAAEAIEKAKTRVDKKRVRLYLTHDCPLSYVNLGSLTFHRYTFKPAERSLSSGVDDEQEPHRIKGQILDVFPAELKRALEIADGRVIRTIRGKDGQIRQAWLHNLSDPSFTVEPDDLALTPYLRVEENPVGEGEQLGGPLADMIRKAEEPAMRPVDEATKSAMRQARQLDVEVPLSPDIPPTLRKK